MSSPPTRRSPAPTGIGHGAGEGGELSGKIPTPYAGRFQGRSRLEAFAEDIEVFAAETFLLRLERTARPLTSAARLKHLAENNERTLHGYISEVSMITAARRLGIPVAADHVAVRVPKCARPAERRWT